MYPCHNQLLLRLLLIGLLLSPAACRERPITVPEHPRPQIVSLSPEAVPAGGADLTLTVTGSGFIPESVVRWNGADRPTTFVSATQLTAAIAAADVESLGTREVVVFNPAPGGGISNALIFTVRREVDQVTVGRRYPSMFVNDTVQLTAVVVGIAGDTLRDRELRWSSSDLGIASVSPEGVVSGLAPGRVTISASTGGVSGSVEVAVLAPRLGSNREIAYLRSVTGSHGVSIYQLRIMRPDGSGATTLSPPDQYVSEFRWSPDGGRIVANYVRSNDVGRAGSFLLNPDGSNEYSLGSYLWSPSWSPDGSRIAYRNQITTGQSDVYTMAANATDVRQLTRAAGDELFPIWSPDGRQIAFLGNVVDGIGDLWLMAADGSDQRRLALPTGVIRFAWSPDGKHLAYSSGDGIWIVTAEGVDPRRITPGCEAVDDCDHPDFYDIPSWSPDARRLAYSLKSFQGDCFVVTSSPDGSGRTEVEVGNCLYPFTFPQWSPDGTLIAFEGQNSAEPGWPSIGLVSADGSAIRLITDAENAYRPQWRP